MTTASPTDKAGFGLFMAVAGEHDKPGGQRDDGDRDRAKYVPLLAFAFGHDRFRLTQSQMNKAAQAPGMTST